MFSWDKIKTFMPYAAPALVVAAILAVLHFMFPVVRVEERIVEKEVFIQDSRMDEVLKSMETLNREVSKMRESNVKESYRKWEHEVTNTDGSKVRDAGEERNIDSVVTETEKVVEVRIVEVEKQVVVTQTIETIKEKEVYKLKEPVLAQWRAGPMVGVAFNSKPSFNGVVYGGEVERRILGPFWLGVWGAGNTKVGGSTGLKLSVEF